MKQEQIPDWAANGPFESLTKAQQMIVLSEMSEASFDQLHQTMSIFAGMDADVTPPASIRANLMQHAALQPAGVTWPSPGRILGLITAFAAGIASTVLVYTMRQPKPELVKTEVVIQHDTIVRIDTIIQYQTRWRIREIQMPSIQPPMAQEIDNQEDKDNLVQSGRGASMQEMPVLMQFIGLELPNAAPIPQSGGQPNLRNIPEKNYRSMDK
jgi:hypothetical protein